MYVEPTHVPDAIKRVSVAPGALVEFRQVGLQVSAGFNDPEFRSQPYVTIGTEDLPPAHVAENGYPMIAVHVNGGTIYDDMGGGPMFEYDASGRTERFNLNDLPGLLSEHAALVRLMERVVSPAMKSAWSACGEEVVSEARDYLRAIKGRRR